MPKVAANSSGQEGDVFRITDPEHYTMTGEQAPVALVFGASRGIGRQICLSLSKAGYVVVLCSKSTGAATASTPDPNSTESTIDTVLHEIEQRGGRGLALKCDVRSETDIQLVFKQVMEDFGRLDALVYNPGAIWWSSVALTPTKRYTLMHEINARGLYIAVQCALPIFKAQSRGRIITISPPIYSRFFRGKTAYSMTKVSASILTIGLSMDFARLPDYADSDIAISALWPAAPIQSAATTRARPEQLRHATIFGDAIVEILKQRKELVNGKLLLDEDFLREQCGYTHARIAEYSLVPGTQPRRIMPAVSPNLTVAEQDDEGDKIDSAKERMSKL